jgi:hypothetical protein
MPEISVSVQAEPAAVAGISDRLPGATPEDVAAAPFILVGTHEQMAAQWRAQAEEFGITSYVVRDPAVPGIERVMALL